MRGLFVTGTDTGVGKSVLTAAVVAALRTAGHGVCPLKPVITGLAEVPDPVWPPDDELLARAAGVACDAVAIERFDPPVSPHLAGELAGRRIDPAALVATIRERAGQRLAIIEGVGGLLVPLAGEFDVRDLARELALPVVLAARPGLGTINHTRLTVEAARAAGLDLRGIVLTPWPSAPDALQRSNRETIEHLTGIAVSGLAPLERPTPEALARAGERLPLADWL
ncbi:MAG TPA: dethiobiotin synthase [Solirubrobacteraceae bacterium]|nr:dethiobiotin synthase [Solirubrobacteraceae bacterium]